MKRDQSVNLCPQCRAEALRFKIMIPTMVTVAWNASKRRLEALEERPGGSQWLASDAASCSQCGWKGTVLDALRGRSCLHRGSRRLYRRRGDSQPRTAG